MTVYSIHASSGLDDCDNSVVYVPSRKEAFELRDRILADEAGTTVTILRVSIKLGGVDLVCSLLNRHGFADESFDVGCWDKDAVTGKVKHSTPRAMAARAKAFNEAAAEAQARHAAERARK